MKVQELIEILSRCDGSSEVYILLKNPISTEVTK